MASHPLTNNLYKFRNLAIRIERLRQPARRISFGLLCIILGTARASATAERAASEDWPQGSHIEWPGDTTAVVDRLLAQMTLEEKVGQMIQADIASITPDELRTFKLGSILAGGNAAPGGNTRSSARDWAALTASYHRASLDAQSASHPPIPLLFGIDAVHGDAKVIGATIFPHNVALGAAHDPDLVRRIARATAEEVDATGIDWTFAPTVAVARDVHWGRSYESYSESPTLVAAYAPAMIAGLQGTPHTADWMSSGHTLSSIKHFVGDGGTLEGRDQGDNLSAESELREVHAAGYLAGINAGALIVMASYNSWKGVKLHGNRYLLTDILKGRLAFDGFVVGDWNAHEQVPGCTKFDCPDAILAGIDMLMAPDSWKQLYENTLREAQSGKIPRERVDDAVRRILRVKAAAGLFQRGAPHAVDGGLLERLGSPEHRAIAREAVRKSLVLLKNENGVLPLRANARILVAGDAADDIGSQSGGWTIDWQGNRNANGDFPGATSIFGGIERSAAAAGGVATLSPDGSFDKKPDVAIVVFGEGPYAEFEGDRETLEFSPGDKHELELLRRLKRQGIPTVSVFLSGRPMWVNPEINASDAFVAAWLPGSEGEGIADVLMRTADGAVPYDFTGRLSFSWPNSAMPVVFHPDDTVSGALFARGSGRDYRQSSHLPRLTEEAGIPPQHRVSAGSLFDQHHVIAPWSIFVADGGEEVHLTNIRQDSPHRAVTAEIVPDGVKADWKGGSTGVFLISGRAVDLTRLAEQGAVLTLRYRLEQRPEKEVKLAMRCTEPMCGGGAALDVTQAFRTAPVETWQTLRLPLSCWKTPSADLKDVEVPFNLSTAGRFSLTISAIQLSPAAPRFKRTCP